MPDYYCHRCLRTFTIDASAAIACTRCQGEFVEFVNVPDQGPSPANALNAIANVLVRSIDDGLARAQDQSQNEPIRRNFLAQLNQMMQQSGRQAQPVQPHQNGQDGQQPQQPQPAQQQPNQPGGQPRNPMQMVFGIQSPAELQDLMTNGLPRLLAGFPFPQRPAAGAEARAPGVPPEPPRQPNGDDHGVPLEPEVEDPSIEGYIRNLFEGFQGGAQEAGEEEHPNVTFSIQWRGNDRSEMEATMNNLLASLNDEHSTRGFTDSDITAFLPMTKVTQEQVDNGAQCTTCFDTFKVNDDVGCLDCKHIFHRPCIEPWLKTKNSCPVCRQKVSMLKWKKQHAKRVRKTQKRRATNRDLQAQEAVLEDLD